jgi:pyruvate dehydrogenase complex dehydrogenase (E1) component
VKTTDTDLPEIRHSAPYASAATLYEVGFDHFFRGKTDEGIW